MTSRSIHFLLGTFIMLYLTHYIPIRKDAEKMMSSINVYGVIITLTIIFIFAVIVDKLKSKVLLPIAYTVTSIALISFQFLGDPTEDSFPLFVVYTVLLTGQMFSVSCLETIFSRVLPKEIRGTMNGVQTFFATIGGLFFTKLGGHLYHELGPKGPFLIIAIANSTFLVLVIVLALLGKIKD
jgi:hypothetical protein